MRESFLLFGFRLVSAIVWLYNGLWLKVLAVDPHHLEIVSPLANDVGLSPRFALGLIGLAESILAIWILTGWLARCSAVVQVVALIAMNSAGILFGGEAIAHPVGLIVGNLPLVAIAVAVAVRGGGAYAIRSP